jgi:hypothetical protein
VDDIPIIPVLPRDTKHIITIESSRSDDSSISLCAYTLSHKIDLLIQRCNSDDYISLARVPVGKSLDDIVAPLHVAVVGVPLWVRLLLTTVIESILLSD